MSIQERHDKLLKEAQALRHFYQIEDKELCDAFTLFHRSFISTEQISSDTFTELLDAVDARLEDICIARKITEELLEVLIDGNEEDLKQYRIY